MGDPFQPLVVLRGRHAGANRGGRGRFQGSSPLTTNAGVFNRSRSWLTPASGRGGELFPRRFSASAWPFSAEFPAGDDEKGLPPLRTPSAPLRETDHNANDGEGEQDGRLSDGMKSSKVASCGKEFGRLADDIWAEREAANAAAAAASAPTRARNGKRSHRRSVTWAGTVETREVERIPQPDVFSPDLHALIIAKQLAIAADAPEIGHAAQEVLMARRQAAAVARSMSASDGWSGNLDGVEETWRAWSNRERLYLRETDELVRSVVSLCRRGDGDGADSRTVYRLKAAYRAARRRMDDADAD